MDYGSSIAGTNMPFYLVFINFFSTPCLYYSVSVQSSLRKIDQITQEMQALSEKWKGKNGKQLAAKSKRCFTSIFTSMGKHHDIPRNMEFEAEESNLCVHSSFMWWHLSITESINPKNRELEKKKKCTYIFKSLVMLA